MSRVPKLAPHKQIIKDHPLNPDKRSMKVVCITECYLPLDLLAFAFGCACGIFGALLTVRAVFSFISHNKKY